MEVEINGYRLTFHLPLYLEGLSLTAKKINADTVRATVLENWRQLIAMLLAILALCMARLNPAHAYNLLWSVSHSTAFLH
jgi:hypothetical protein